jgi:thymidylate synthase
MHIEATSIADAWFQALYNLRAEAYRQDIHRGSFAGEQYRLQYPWLSMQIDDYTRDVVPVMPPGSGIPEPTTWEKNREYADAYLLGCKPKAENEAYTYAERIGNQLDAVMRMIAATPSTNQANITVGRPEDLELKDPACLRTIDIKIVDGRVNISTFWRSWDLWAGLPVNLGGLAIVAEYVAAFCGLKPGRMYAASPGAHIYGYHVALVESRTGQDLKSIADPSGQ